MSKVEDAFALPAICTTNIRISPRTPLFTRRPASNVQCYASRQRFSTFKAAFCSSTILPTPSRCFPTSKFSPLNDVDHTAFPGAPTVYYEPVDDVENLVFYQQGGHHPIKIGDRLHDRYRVVHKLGYGTYSIIWLAKDETLSKYVAVKVGIADAKEGNEKEIDILADLSNLPLQDGKRGKEFIPPMLDRFSVHGPNGTHSCLVTAPARCSLVLAKGGYLIYQLPVAQSLAAQLAMAVAYIHKQGLVHGDLHLNNMLLQLPSTLDHLSEEQLYNQYKPPNLQPVRRADGKPLASGVPDHTFWPIWLGVDADKVPLSESKLVLTDFGTSFYPAQETRLKSFAPLEVEPPEARFEPTTPLTLASDIWSLALGIWSIMGQRPFLNSWLFDPDDATEDAVDALGPLPSEWWEKWEAWFESFTEDGKPTEGRIPCTWDERFDNSIQNARAVEGMEPLDDEANAFREMIRWMLAFRPGERPSADQVLETTWMKKWAIPEAEKTWEDSEAEKQRDDSEAEKKQDDSEE